MDGDILESPSSLLESSLMGKLAWLPCLPNIVASIARLPEGPRYFKHSMCTPKVVSIGPYHYRREELRAMEEYKMRCLLDFIRMSGKHLRYFIKVVQEREAELRAYYAEAITLTSDEFVELILVDATFIIVFLLRLNFSGLRDKADRAFGSALISQDGWFDLLLLENQLPFFILVDLFNFGIQYKIDFFYLLCNFFKWLMHLEVQESTLQGIRSSKIKHFVDLLRHLHCPHLSQYRREFQTTTSLSIDSSLLGRMEPGVETIRATIPGITELPSITELHKAGVRLKLGKTSNLFDIQFKNGILEIPKLTIGKESGITIHNMLFFEKCSLVGNYMHDSIQLMGVLIRTQKDVDLLVHYGILEQRLDRTKVLPLIQELADETFSDWKGWYFDGLYENLNTYCRHSSRRWRARWYDWKENLIDTYFETPWSGISVIAAVVLLTLTVVQTVYAILSFHSSRSVGE